MTQPGGAFAHAIGADDVAAYRRDGFFLYHHQLFSSPKLARLTEIFEEHVAGMKPGQRSDELDVPHFRDARLLDFLLADEALDLVEPFIGPNIGLWSSHFIAKEPHVGRATPWHEDSAYWKGRTDRMDGIVTVWLALDDSTEENGCMRVIRGSHLLGGSSDYEPVDRRENLFGSQIKPELIDESKDVPFELRRGECSLHDARLIHGARPNTSDQRRCGYTMRYFNTETHVYPENARGHQIWLARGRDLGNNTWANRP